MLMRKYAWIAFGTLLLVVLLTLVAMMYWQHATGTNFLHLLADDESHGC